MIVRGAKRRGLVGTITGGALAGVLVIAACEAPAPTELTPGSEVQEEFTATPVLTSAQTAGAVTEGAPLFIVDGERIATLPSDLQAAVIASVEVIKGAAAVKVYGPDAENGVVIITTTAAGDGASVPAPGNGQATVRLREVGEVEARRDATIAGQFRLSAGQLRLGTSTATQAQARREAEVRTVRERGGGNQLP